MTSPLPPGCKFYVYPEFRIDYEGRVIPLGRYQAEILLILMSKPGRSFSASEIATELYKDRDDGGPYSWESVISKQILTVRDRFTQSGLALNLKTGHGHMRFVYHPSSISVLEKTDGWSFPAWRESA